MHDSNTFTIDFPLFRAMDYNIYFTTNTVSLYLRNTNGSDLDIQLSKSDINISNNYYNSILLMIPLSLMQEKGFTTGSGFCTLHNYGLKIEPK